MCLIIFNVNDYIEICSFTLQLMWSCHFAAAGYATCSQKYCFNTITTNTTIDYETGELL